MERWGCGYGMPAMLSGSHNSASKHLSKCQYSSEGDCFLLLSECKTWTTGTWSWRYYGGSFERSARTRERGIFVRTCIVATWYRVFCTTDVHIGVVSKVHENFYRAMAPALIFRIDETTARKSVSVSSVKLHLVVLKGRELSVSGAEKSSWN